MDVVAGSGGNGDGLFTHGHDGIACGIGYDVERQAGITGQEYRGSHERPGIAGQTDRKPHIRGPIE